MSQLMNKAQVIHNFWSGFGLTAYDESTVPIGDDAPKFPYITYTFRSGSMDDSGRSLTLTGSLWYRSTSWAGAENLAEQIASSVKDMRPIECDSGYVWIRQGNPFQERVPEPSDDMVRRIRITLDVKFITTR